MQLAFPWVTPKIRSVLLLVCFLHFPHECGMGTLG